jgi:stage III sporulation protein AG
MPDIKGVVVVAEGANNIKLRLELLRATTTALSIDENKVEIFKMKINN